MDKTIETISQLSGFPVETLFVIFQELGIPYLKYNKFSHDHYQDSGRNDCNSIEECISEEYITTQSQKKLTELKQSPFFDQSITDSLGLA